MNGWMDEKKLGLSLYLVYINSLNSAKEGLVWDSIHLSHSLSHSIYSLRKYLLSVCFR